MMRKMNKKDVLAWIKGFEAARELERQLSMKDPLDRERSVRLALSLIAACRARGTWPRNVISDTKWEQEVEEVRDRWNDLKKAYAK